MSFTLKPAKRGKISLLFAIAGASGSGKTYSALLLASGIAGNKGKIAVIDTEAGRALQYAPRNGEKANPENGTFDFLHLDFKPTFSPDRYIEAIKVCEDAGAEVIVIDSASHEWNGEGGVAELADEIALEKATDKRTGDIDFRRFEAVKLLSWAEPKKRHKKMMAKLTQVRAHIIFCLRAEDKVKMVRENGKNVITNPGFQPICEKGFMFEMTASMTMSPENPGCPDYSLDKKLNNDMQAIFPNKKKVTTQQGQLLKQWAEAGIIGNPSSQDTPIHNVDPEPEPPQQSTDTTSQQYEWFITYISQIKAREQLEKLTSNNKFMDLRKKLNPEQNEKLQQVIHHKLQELEMDDLPSQSSQNEIPNRIEASPYHDEEYDYGY